MELLRIRARLNWREKKIPTIEAAILVEALLREYARRALQTRGFSSNRIKSLGDELSFNTFLNIVLPLTLSKSVAARLEKNIRKVDALRRTRNDLVHGNVSGKDVDEASVRDSIDGALSLVAFVRGKLGGTK